MLGLIQSTRNVNELIDEVSETTELTKDSLDGDLDQDISKELVLRVKANITTETEFLKKLNINI